MGILVFVITIAFLFWAQALHHQQLNQNAPHRRFSAASDFMLDRVRWTATAWTRAIFMPGWMRRYRETICSMIGMIFFADGKVTDDEISVLKEILSRHFHSLDPNFHARVVRQMVAAKFSGDGIEKYARRLKVLVAADPAMLENTLLLLLSVAASEGRVSPSERKLLEIVCREFGISQSDFADLVKESGAIFTSTEDPGAEQARARADQRKWQENRARQEQQTRQAAGGRQEQSAPQDDYAVLGLTRGASAAEIKKAFRTLALKYHPDRLRSQGLPPEMAARSEKKFRQIKDAYERIMEK